MTRRILLVVFLIVSAAVELGCSSERIVVLSEQPNLVSGRSSQWRRMTGEAIPLEYEIRRADYVVALRAFDNGSAGLDVQPKTLLGVNLELRSDQPFMDAIRIGLAPDSWPDGYRYWILPNWVKGQPFRFSVVDPTGHVLGNEELSYREVRVVAWEGFSGHGA